MTDPREILAQHLHVASCYTTEALPIVVGQRQRAHSLKSDGDNETERLLGEFTLALMQFVHEYERIKMEFDAVVR